MSVDSDRSDLDDCTAAITYSIFKVVILPGSDPRRRLKPTNSDVLAIEFYCILTHRQKLNSYIVNLNYVVEFMGRSNKGLHPPALEAWVRASKNQSNPNKKMVGLMLPFVGMRNDVFCHIHGPTWFSWTDPDTGKTVDGDPPKIKIPGMATCHVNGHTDPCPSCIESGTERFTTKYDDERAIPLAETWENWNRGKSNRSVTEDLGLRSFCKQYFKVTPSDHGKEMVGPKGNGVCSGTVNKWVKEIARDAEIGFERGLIDSSYFDRQVPDVKPHDMRGTFIMQLIRNNMHRTKLIKYTGHAHVDSLAPYEERVAQETDAHEFLAKI